LSYLNEVITRALRASGRIVPLVRAGLIVGVALAAVSYPIAAGAGLGVKAGADALKSLPSNLVIPPLAQTTYIYANDGKTLLTTFYDEDRKFVPITKMSPYIQQAIVASEDSRFYEHHGVDMRGVARAFVANNQSGEVSQGASTLTMQYVRNALRDGAQTPEDALEATEQTNTRKVREMNLALQLEKKMTKTQILEGYLNLAYFGHQAYGIYAASQIYFSTTPDKLTLPQAAMIAGIVQAPTTYDPTGSDKSAAVARRNYVINRMAELGYISPAEKAAAGKTGLHLDLSTPPNDCVSINRDHTDWGYFCDMFKQWWLNQPAFGKTADERLDALRRGGYTVVTSLSPRVQTYAQSAVLDNKSRKSPIGLGEVVVQPGTGKVKAMAINRTYSLDQSDNPRSSNKYKRGKGIPANYPNTVAMLDGGGDLPGYQAGSTFKMFTMLTALSMGYTLDMSYFAPATLKSKYLGNCGGRWCVKNAGGSDTGRHNMYSGLGMSVNTYWVQVEQKVGAANVVAMAQRLGIHFRTKIDQMMASPKRANGWGAFTLGVADTTPLEVANAFATVAAQGVYCQPLPVESITGPDGKPAMMEVNGERVEVAAPRCYQAVSKDVARAATDAARCVTGYGAVTGGCGGTPTGAGVYQAVGRPVAGKSGTTDADQAAWFTAFTPQLAASAFVSDPDNPRNPAGGANHPLPRVTVQQTLHNASRGLPVEHFTPPSHRMTGKAHPLRKLPQVTNPYANMSAIE
jgi:membrane peptidoglycan carboxypeptidase